MIDVRPRQFHDLVGYPSSPGGADDTHGTTVLSLRYKHGVLMLADRRATMGNLIMYDHADKVVALDDSTVVAISGSFARAVEVCRFLKHGFMYYRRMHLMEMSLEGKLQEITRALAANLPAAMEGGIFLPILGAYDRSTGKFQIYFFDAAGARFQGANYACAGSGSERIRGVFELLRRTKGPWEDRSLKEVLLDGMRMLDIASDLDSATGGFSKVLPAACALESDGCREIDEATLRAAAEKVLEAQE